ncbi:MAG TPA: transaldolase [Thermomicrobiales bacterium]|nr:transaldolase [Thermomicrobiales bacterium]
MVRTADEHLKAQDHPANRLLALAKVGQSVWLDFITRELVRKGKLQWMIDEDGLRGMTSNPTIFQKAIAGSDDYDDQLAQLAQQGKNAEQIFEGLAVTDIQEACDHFRPLYDRTNGEDGFVSIEVGPSLAHDTAGTIAEARRLWKKVNRPNVMVKVPGTEEGWPAVEQLIGEGLNINITLLFSLRNHEQVMWRYIAGLEKRAAAGQPLDHIASVASFFVSRVDTLVDKLLEQRIAQASGAEAETLRGLLGKSAIANAKLAYRNYQRIFSHDRFLNVKAKGARVQRCLWASTSTKNAAYSDVLYVDSLIGPDTVNTLPLATIEAFKDHGTVARTLTEGVEEASATLGALAEAGIDYDAVTKQLEDEGVDAFAKSFDELIAGVEQKRKELHDGR